MAGNEIHYHFYGPQQNLPTDSSATTQTEQEQSTPTAAIDPATILNILEQHRLAIVELAEASRQVAVTVQDIKNNLLKNSMAASAPTPTNSTGDKLISTVTGREFAPLSRSPRKGSKKHRSKYCNARESVPKALRLRAQDASYLLLRDLCDGKIATISPVSIVSWLEENGYGDLNKYFGNQPWSMVVGRIVNGSRRRMKPVGKDSKGNHEWAITEDGIAFVKNDFKYFYGKNRELLPEKNKTVEQKKLPLDNPFESQPRLKGRERGLANEPNMCGVTSKMNTQMTGDDENYEKEEGEL